MCDESQHQVLHCIIFGSFWFEFRLLQTLGAYNSDHLPEGTYIQNSRTEWCLHKQKMCGKLKDFEKLPTNSSIRSVSWEGYRTLITILLRTVTFSSDAVQFSSVTVCCTLFAYPLEAWTERSGHIWNVTSQEAECFEQWPGWDEVNCDGRTLQCLCFYSRTPMTKQAILALSPDIPEFHTWILSLRTF